MSGLFCGGTCDGSNRHKDDQVIRDIKRTRYDASPQNDSSPFWRPLNWCPEDGTWQQVNRDRPSNAEGFLEVEKTDYSEDLDPFKQASWETAHLRQMSRQKLEEAATRIQSNFRGRKTRINSRASISTFNRTSSTTRGSMVSESNRYSAIFRPGDLPPSEKINTSGNSQAPKAATPELPSAPAKPLQEGQRKCTIGHNLVKKELPLHSKPKACAMCRRSFVAKAKMWTCSKCDYWLCEACGGTESSGLKPGTRVQLCGMNNRLLNCMNGIVEARADQNRYTVLISDLGDYITLPGENLGQARDSSDGEESSGSEVHDANNPTTKRKSANAKRKSVSRRALDTVVAKSRKMITRMSMAARKIIGTDSVEPERDSGPETGQMTDGTKSMQMPLLQAWWAEKKQLAKEQMLELSAPMRKRMLENIGEFVKDSAMRDPEMWAWVRPVVKSAVSGIWDDIEVEIESNIEVAVTDQRTERDLHAQARKTPGPRFRSQLLNRYGSLFLRFRAFVLYHYLPCDKTFFGKLKDPVYDIMVGFTMLPLFGVRVCFFSGLLLMLLIPGPADEYQLVSYILHFKGTMFFTSGVIMLFLGAMEYNRCYLFHYGDLRDCIENSGPGADQWLCTLVMDYLGSITLVWVAWLVLPCTQKFPSHVESMRGWCKKEDERSTYCCCLEGITSRGGRLGSLLHYDVICFISSFCLMVPVYWVTFDPAVQNLSYTNSAALWVRAKAVTYWCQVLYALFSLPFALFVIPVFSWLLTHSTFTGYNQKGACVEFAFPVAEGAEDTPC